ncbi:MAG: O-antigen ligase family protein [Acidobacteria bacterium]|nr:O-antigen ligase family protein [Acidobacteriota bacterium]
MFCRNLQENRSERRQATLIMAVGAAATLVIWRQSEWETLVANAMLLALCSIMTIREYGLGTGRDWRGWLAVSAVGLLACLGFWQGCSTSEVPYRSFRSALDWTAASATLWAMWTLCRQNDVRSYVLNVTVLLGVVVCVLATLQFYTSEGRIFWIWQAAEPQVFGPFQSRNNYASFALLMFPLVIWKGLQGRPRWHFLAAGAIIGGSIVASGSRAGVLLFAVELVVLFWLYRKERWAVAGAGVLLTAAILISGWSQLEHKLFDSDPFRYRREMLGSAVQMLREKPVTGHGLGTFPAVYPAFAEFDSGHYVNHAHNDWAELGAEGGVVAIVLLGVFVVCVLVSVAGNPWGIGVPLVFVHGMVDYPLQRLGVLFWVLVLGSALIASRFRWKHFKTQESERSREVTQVD